MSKAQPHQTSDDTSASVNEGASLDITAVEIQRARVEARLSVVELSKATGISKAVIHGYERGRTKPGARELRLLSEALQVSPNRLLLGTDEFISERPVFTALYRKMRTRPGMVNLLGMMLFPMVASVLDEREAESLLTIIDSLIRGKDPELGRRLAVMAAAMAEMFDHMTNDDGSIKSLTPAEMAALQADAMAKAQTALAAPD